MKNFIKSFDKFFLTFIIFLSICLFELSEDFILFICGTSVIFLLLKSVNVFFSDFFTSNGIFFFFFSLIYLYFILLALNRRLMLLQVCDTLLYNIFIIIIYYWNVLFLVSRFLSCSLMIFSFSILDLKIFK